MTRRDERTRAVLEVREFLRRLSSPAHPDAIDGIADEVRAEARALLRHYPTFADLMDEDAFDKEVAQRQGLKEFAGQFLDARKRLGK